MIRVRVGFGSGTKTISDQAPPESNKKLGRAGPDNEVSFSNISRTASIFLAVEGSFFYSSLSPLFLSASLISGESSHFTCSRVTDLCAENKTPGEQDTASGN